MDGVILTGGLASRLRPITTVTNKHLLPIYDKPLLFHGIETLKKLGCHRIVIVLGGNSVGDIVNLVRDGSAFGVEVVYKFQHEPKGISDAIRLAQDIVDSDDSELHEFLVLLGDNIFGDVEKLQPLVKQWRRGSSYNQFAVFLSESEHPHDYGQPVFSEDGSIVKFVEKDISVNHTKIVTGLYGLNSHAFYLISDQKPSERGEYEITDTLNGLACMPLLYDGFWSDCGTPEGLIEASNYMMEKAKVTA